MIGVEFRGETGYTRIEEIGRGEGMNSTVYRVFDARLNGEYAAKEISKANFMRGVDEYFTEAQTMAAADHPNVVPIRCCCETPEIISLIMPLYTRGSLGRLIQNGPLPPSDVLTIGRQFLLGLTKIHLVGRFHLDIKPSNVLFADAGHALLADFGQSCRVEDDGSANPPPMYHFAMPPEFFQYFTVVAQSDIYQAGVTLYRAVNGDPFFAPQKPAADDLADRIAAGKFPDRNAFLPHVPKRLRTVLRKAMSLESEDRYQSAQEFGNELGKVTVAHNWNVTGDINGSMEWRAKRRKKSDIIVRRRANGAAWNVELWQDSGKGERRVSRDAWRKCNSQKVADGYLKSVFELLG